MTGETDVPNVDDMVKCPSCNGYGSIRVSASYNQGENYHGHCHRCHGTGKRRFGDILAELK